MKLTPYYYQKQAFDAIFKYTAENWGKHPLVVLPTGAGKSFLQAMCGEKVLSYPNTRVLFLTHQKKLIEQNYDEFVGYMDGLIDVGIYQAALKRRDTMNRTIFGGIQSVYKKAWEIGWFDVIFIDEAHLIPHKSEGMYRTFLDEMMKINPNIVIVGLSATPFRMKEGLLTEGEGALFDAICHETTVTELINPDDPRNLDNKQYLCKIISPKKGMKSKADLSKVHIRGKEYIPKEMQDAFMEDDLVCKAVQEIKEYTIDRKKILVFSAGIDHGEEVTRKLNNQGLEARMIHSKQGDEINDKNIDDFKAGLFRFLVNVDILTTGFNEKAVDCIVLLRSTRSPGLYYQMVGRGLRIHPDKIDCLVLDFGSNIILHGPIDKIEVRKKKDGSTEIHTAPEKECPQCQSLLHLSIMECPDCGYLFEQKDKHDDKASEANILSEWKKPEEIKITKIAYNRHCKKDKPDSFRVDYYYNMFEKYSTYVCIEHGGFAQKKALQWLRNVTECDINSVDEALEECNNFRKPSKIIVDTNGKFPNITGYIFEDIEAEAKEEEVADEALWNLM